MVLMRHLVGGLLAELDDIIDRDKFKRVLQYSRRLLAFQNRAKLVSGQRGFEQWHVLWLDRLTSLFVQ